MSVSFAPSRIAVYRPGALGDTIVTFPVLEAFRTACPAAHITAVGRREYFGPALSTGYVDDVLSADAAWAGRWFGGDADALSNALPDTDLMVIYGRDTDGVLADTAQRAGVTRCIVHPALPPDGSDIHITDHLLSAVSAAGIPVHSRTPHIVSSSRSRLNARGTMRSVGIPPGTPYVVVHAGASTPARVWPKLHETAAWVQNTYGLPVAVNAGPVEYEREITDQWPSGTRFIGPSDVDTLTGVLAEAAAYIGGDTGPTHLAAAIGTPTVAVFGSESDPVRWQPRGEQVTVVVSSTEHEWPDADAVKTAAREIIPAQILPEHTDNNKLNS